MLTRACALAVAVVLAALAAVGAIPDWAIATAVAGSLMGLLVIGLLRSASRISEYDVTEWESDR